jgi:FliI/YscN family ATPase
MLERMGGVSRFATYGRATRVVGLVIEASGLDVPLGELCRVSSLSDESTVLAEVVGFHDRGVLLMPLGGLEGVHPGSIVEPLGRSFGVDVGPGLLGRVLNGLGQPIDEKGGIGETVRMPLSADPVNPLVRETIDEPLATGVRAIDGPLTLGRGQRVGIFAGSGVGKSTLLGMIARRASADVNVIALLGERGREVRDFIENSLGPEGLARSVVVVATGDEAALVRARGALVATAIAEYFRDEGKQVLLMVDSVTRVAMAWREIGLAVGEPPTTKGYPPSVFAALPRLLERAGNGATGGISGIYTVLVEGDDFNEPICDAVRGILDGHVVLSRALGASGHYPAVDVLQSVSRVMPQIVAPDHLKASQKVREALACYERSADLIQLGAYVAGTNPKLDVTLRSRDKLLGFLKQDSGDKSPIQETLTGLAGIASELG